jgi:thiamine-phosphate pyrophosphorylase
VILHLVTDRRRLCPSGDEPTRSARLVEQARYAVDAAIDVIQLRERDLEAGALVDLASMLVAVTRGTSTRLVINERFDVALAVAADGVHLRSDSFDAEQVRRRAPAGFLVGRSVHSLAELRVAGPVDYVIAGTVWATPSKPENHDLLGVEGLTAIAASSPVPVIAIGGVDASRAPRVAATGAAGLAGIGIFQGYGPEFGPIALRDTAEVLHKAFSTGNM